MNLNNLIRVALVIVAVRPIARVLAMPTCYWSIVRAWEFHVEGVGIEFRGQHFGTRSTGLLGIHGSSGCVSILPLLLRRDGCARCTISRINKNPEP